MTTKLGDMTETNFPVDADGRTYHLGIKKGDVANQILIVGDPERAERIAACFDNQNITRIETNRGFTTLTGLKNGKRVTIMSIGMGLPMADFFMREVRHVAKGPLDIIRLGSCGTPHDGTLVKTLVIAKKSFVITPNYDAFGEKDTGNIKDYYRFSNLIDADPVLTDLLAKKLEAASQGLYPVCVATDATADSFYSSQGRIDPNFDDRNAGLMDKMLEKYPDTRSLQMETGQLYHLARLAKDIHVTGCAIVLAERRTGVFLPNEDKHKIEVRVGDACLDLLAQRASMPSAS